MSGRMKSGARRTLGTSADRSSSLPSSEAQPQPNRSKAQKNFRNPRGTRSTTPRILFRNHEHEEKYEFLSRRRLIPTRFMDLFALNVLGLREEIDRLLLNIVWTAFSLICPPTFEELTLEFLSSYSFDSSIGSTDFGISNFRIANQSFSLPLAQINDMFGFDNTGSCYMSANFEEQSFWLEITGTQPYIAKVAKSSKIVSPALRYIHRFLAHSIFGRGESTGVVTKLELYFLFCMVRRLPLNTGYWLCLKFADVSRGKTGDIVIGGLITHIAEKLGVMDINDTSLKRVQGRERIDMQTMVQMKLAECKGGEYVLIRPQAPVAADREEDMDDILFPSVDAEPSIPTGSSGGSATFDMVMQRLDTLDLSMTARIDMCEQNLNNRFNLVQGQMQHMDNKLSAFFNHMGFVYPSYPPQTPPES